MIDTDKIIVPNSNQECDFAETMACEECLRGGHVCPYDDAKNENK